VPKPISFLEGGMWVARCSGDRARERGGGGEESVERGESAPFVGYKRGDRDHFIKRGVTYQNKG